MSDKPFSLSDYLAPEKIYSLARPANLRLGEEIAKDSGVEIVESSPERIVARVRPRGGVHRTVELSLGGEGLNWKCTCTKSSLFCKHCVAVGIAISL